MCANWKQIYVSIRSPHRSKGRLVVFVVAILIALFQSAPLTEARGDLAVFGWFFFAYVSIRSPHRSKGRPCRFWLVLFRLCFNPLPSPKQGETFFPPPSLKIRDGFQSAPLTEARGDSLGAGRCAGRRGFNPLPSPKQGETGKSSSSSSPGTGFNPLPSPKQGETRPDVAKYCASCRFNPLPSPKQGETWSASPAVFRSVWFQSAPLTEARGDLRACLCAMVRF